MFTNYYQVTMSTGKKASSQNVRVVCRIRPTNQKEIQSGGANCVKHNENSIEVTTEENATNNFAFDKIFGPESLQLDVFDYTAVPLIQDVLQGYNATIFAYGQVIYYYTYL